MQRTFLAGGLLAAALVLAACGDVTPDTVDTTDVGNGAAAGSCLEGTPDCDDTGILDGDATDATNTADAADTPTSAGLCAEEAPDCDDTVVLHDPADPADPADDAFDSQAAITDAEDLLGLAEPELGPDVRIGRRGEEQLMLTEDYVIGRMTVELDINDMDEWIVTAVTVELPDGPQTVTRYLT